MIHPSLAGSLLLTANDPKLQFLGFSYASGVCAVGMELSWLEAVFVGVHRLCWKKSICRASIQRSDSV